jgi:hypothetical protein
MSEPQLLEDLGLGGLEKGEEFGKVHRMVTVVVLGVAQYIACASVGYLRIAYPISLVSRRRVAASIGQGGHDEACESLFARVTR